MRRLVVLALLIGPFACTGGSLVMAPTLAASATVEAPSAAPLVDAGAPPEIPSFVGSWSGRGQQSDGQGWAITLDVAASGGSVRAHVTYPTLACGGEWTLEATTAREWEGDEHLSYGTNHCIENGIVHLRLTDAGVLEFDWREIGGQGSTARGTLRRVPGRR